MLMRHVNYTIKRLARGGVPSSTSTVNLQLPTGGNKLLHAALMAVRCYPSRESWALIKAAALEVSATGSTRTMNIGPDHKVVIELAD